MKKKTTKTLALRTLFLMLVSMSAANATAVSKLSVYISCSIRSSPGGISSTQACADFKLKFYSMIDLYTARTENEGDADLALAVTSDEGDSQGFYRYTFQWKARHSLSNFTDDSSYTIKLNQSLDPSGDGDDRTITTLVNNSVIVDQKIAATASDYGRGMYLYLPLAMTVSESSHLITLTLQNAAGGSTDAPLPKWSDKLAESPLYINASLGASYSSSGSGMEQTTSESKSASLETAYLKDRWAVDVIGSYNNVQISVPYYNPATGANTIQSGSLLSKSVTGMAVYTLSNPDHCMERPSGCFSVALIHGNSTAAASNINSASNTAIAMEYSLYPIRKKDVNHEFAARAGLANEQANLVQENEFNQTHVHFNEAFVQIYFYWLAMKDKLTLSGTITQGQNLNFRSDHLTTISFNPVYQITPSIGLSGSLSYAIQPVSMVYPENPNYANVTQSNFLPGAAGKNISTSIRLTITLGNSVRKTQQKRFNQIMQNIPQ